MRRILIYNLATHPNRFNTHCKGRTMATTLALLGGSLLFLLGALWWVFRR